MSSTRPLSIAIVGGGATGAMAACQLARALRGRPFVIDIFEKRELAAGLAYAGGSDALLLNVRPQAVTLWPGEPEHFAEWLAQQHPESLRATAAPFVPRHLFRQYLQQQIAAYGEIRVRAHDVTALRAHGDAWRLQSDGTEHTYDEIFVATGYRRDFRPLPELAALPPGRWHSVFALAELPTLHAQRDLVVIGSQLSAIDALRWVRAQGFTGRVHFLSRHGHLPRSHGEVPAAPPPAPAGSAAFPDCVGRGAAASPKAPSRFSGRRARTRLSAHPKASAASARHLASLDAGAAGQLLQAPAGFLEYSSPLEPAPGLAGDRS